MLRIFILVSLVFWTFNAKAETSAEKGRKLYLSYGCALCHGPEGQGNGINGQKLRPPPTDFHDPGAYLHGSDADSIRRSIQYGIKEDNSIMPAFEDIPTEELGALVSYLQSLQAANNGIAVTDAWVMAVPPSEMVSAAFMTIANNTSKDMVLVFVDSSIAQTAELHQMSEANGMMRMAKVRQIDVPAKAKAVLGPKGFHVMLINLKKPVKEGDMVPITLQFQDGSAVAVNAKVKPDDQ